MNEYRYFAHKIGINGIAQLLIGLSTIIILPVLTKSLSIEDYGIYVLICVTIGLIPPLVSIGLPYTMVRFLAVMKNRADIQEEFYSIAIIVGCLAGITTLILLFLVEKIAMTLFNGHIMIAQIFCIILFLESINGFLINYFRTFQQIRLYSIFLIFRTILQLGLISFFVLQGYGIFGAIIGIFITNFFFSIIMATKIYLEIGFVIPKFLHLREHIKFCIPTIPGTASFWIINSSDRYVIGIFLGAAFIGYYSPAYTLGNIVLFFSAPLMIILPPVLSKYYDENKKESVNVFLSYSLKYYLLLTIPSAIGISILSKSLLMILSTPEIALNAYLITPFIAISALLSGISLIIAQIFSLIKKTGISAKIWIFAAFLNLGLNLFFIPRLGLIGAAITTLVAYTAVFLLAYYYSSKYLTFDLNLVFILKCILSSIVMGITMVLFSNYNNNNLIQILILTIIGGLIYFICLFIIGGFKKEEIKFFFTIFQ